MQVEVAPCIHPTIRRDGSQREYRQAAGAVRTPSDAGSTIRRGERTSTAAALADYGEAKNGIQTGNTSSWRGALYGHQSVGPGGELVHYRARQGRRYGFFCSRGRCGLSTCDQGCRVADGSVLLAAE